MSAVATTRMSSKGQIIIPQAIRRKLRFKPGMEFLVFGGEDAIRLRRIQALKTNDLVASAARLRGYVRRAGLKRSDVRRARNAVRAEERENAFWRREAEKALADAKRRGEDPIPFEQVERDIDAARAKAPRKRTRAAK